MSSIVTFYSYKGGVGRSMALANIAHELAKRNKKVLMIDWDLEAPGLERYFSNFTINKSGDGLLPLLKAMATGEPDYNGYLWTIATTFQHPVYLLHSGREKNAAQYSADLENFKWEDFFSSHNGGAQLERLRNEWLKDFDLVLIDSRTGLSDASGVCTIMLPDVVIPMFTANYQSLFGILDIMTFIQSARQKLSVDRMALTILPVPSRFGTRVEFKQSQEWLDRIADILKDCFSDWLPKWIEPRYVIEQVKIPQVDYFSFGEKLAVAEQGTSDPESMGFVYAKLADFLASDFTDIETFIGKSYYEEKKVQYENAQRQTKTSGQEASLYKYDVYISFPRSAYQWVKEVLAPTLTEFLQEDLGRAPSIYIDASEISFGESWNDATSQAIEQSKVFLLVYSDQKTKNTFQENELIFIDTTQKITAQKIVFSVVFGRSDDFDFAGIPPFIRDNLVTDLSTYTSEIINSSKKVSALFVNEVQRLAEMMVQSLVAIDKTGTQTDLKTDARTQIDSLSSAYEDIRKMMTSGNNRTRLMQDIVEKMRVRADDYEPLLPELTGSESAGHRLAAITVLQQKPNLQYIGWLADHVGDVEKPFVGYQASVALYIASRSLGSDNKEELSGVINKAMVNINKYQYKDPNQVSVLHSAKAYLDLK